MLLKKDYFQISMGGYWPKMNNNEALILKYRPQDFEAVVGQEAVVTSLRQAIQKQTARAFLFCGPSGTGKTTLARITARSLGCDDSNISEVDAATHTGIDAMRALVDLVQYQPLTGTTERAVIIDECHAISAAAWKSLLKNVEEPPPGLYWFFCTTDPDKVPTTIRTRCASYGLKLVGLDDLLDLIEAVVELEETTLDPKIAYLVAKEANGSPRQALANLAVCLGCESEEAALDLLHAAKEGDQEIMDLCRDLIKGGLTWVKVQGYLLAFEGTDAESIRMTIAAYLVSVLKSTKSDESAVRVLTVLDNFSTSWAYDRSQQTSLCLALGRCLYNTE